MEQSEAQTILDELASEFHTPKVKVEFTNRRNSGYYNSQSKVRIGNREPMPVVDALLHEFTHHLCHTMYEKVRPHGREFVHHLCRVIRYWYNGTLNKYSWHLEYKTVALSTTIGRSVWWVFH